MPEGAKLELKVEEVELENIIIVKGKHNNISKELFPDIIKKQSIYVLKEKMSVKINSAFDLMRCAVKNYGPHMFYPSDLINGESSPIMNLSTMSEHNLQYVGEFEYFIYETVNSLTGYWPKKLRLYYDTELDIINEVIEQIETPFGNFSLNLNNAELKGYELLGDNVSELSKEIFKEIWKDVLGYELCDAEALEISVHSDGTQTFSIFPGKFLFNPEERFAPLIDYINEHCLGD